MIFKKLFLIKENFEKRNIVKLLNGFHLCGLLFAEWRVLIVDLKGGFT